MGQDVARLSAGDMYCPDIERSNFNPSNNEIFRSFNTDFNNDSDDDGDDYDFTKQENERENTDNSGAYNSYSDRNHEDEVEKEKLINLYKNDENIMKIVSDYYELTFKQLYKNYANDNFDSFKKAMIVIDKKYEENIKYMTKNNIFQNDEDDYVPSLFSNSRKIGTEKMEYFKICVDLIKPIESKVIDILDDPEYEKYVRIHLLLLENRIRVKNKKNHSKSSLKVLSAFQVIWEEEALLYDKTPSKISPQKIKYARDFFYSKKHLLFDFNSFYMSKCAVLAAIKLFCGGKYRLMGFFLDNALAWCNDINQEEQHKQIMRKIKNHMADFSTFSFLNECINTILPKFKETKEKESKNEEIQMMKCWILFLKTISLDHIPSNNNPTKDDQKSSNNSLEILKDHKKLFVKIGMSNLQFLLDKLIDLEYINPKNDTWLLKLHKKIVSANINGQECEICEKILEEIENEFSSYDNDGQPRKSKINPEIFLKLILEDAQFILDQRQRKEQLKKINERFQYQEYDDYTQSDLFTVKKQNIVL